MSQFGVQFHGKSASKAAGNGKVRLKTRDRRRHEVGGYFISTTLAAEPRSKTIRQRGGNVTSRLTRAAFANVLTSTGYKRVKIKAILESKDNRNFARLNIITKGTVIDTEAGKAVVTNRPGREGSVNARLMEGRSNS